MRTALFLVPGSEARCRTAEPNLKQWFLSSRVSNEATDSILTQILPSKWCAGATILGLHNALHRFAHLQYATKQRLKDHVLVPAANLSACRGILYVLHYATKSAKNRSVPGAPKVPLHHLHLRSQGSFMLQLCFFLSSQQERLPFWLLRISLTSLLLSLIRLQKVLQWVLSLSMKPRFPAHSYEYQFVNSYVIQIRWIFYWFSNIGAWDFLLIMLMEKLECKSELFARRLVDVLIITNLHFWAPGSWTIAWGDALTTVYDNYSVFAMELLQYFVYTLNYFQSLFWREWNLISMQRMDKALTG